MQIDFHYIRSKFNFGIVLLSKDKPLADHLLNDLDFLLGGACVHIYAKSKR